MRSLPTNILKDIFRPFAPKSVSRRNVLKLVGGTASSQVIAVAATPILTRLYGPESFGLLITFSSILALLIVVCSLRYESAIVVPEEDEDAITLAWLCFFLVGISSCITAIAVLLFGDRLIILLNEPAFKPLLYLLPIGVLLAGIYQILNYWAIRKKQFGLLGKTKLYQNIFGIGISLALFNLNAAGLILGQILSQSAGSVPVFHYSRQNLLPPLIRPQILVKTFRRYAHFGLYSSPAGLINIVGSQLPIIIFSSFFGAQLVGQLALAQRILLVPAGLVGTSVARVFFAQAMDHYRVGSLSSLVNNASRKLLIFSLVSTIPFAIASSLLIPKVFGDEWSLSGLIILILIPLCIGQLTVSSVSTAFLANEQNQIELIAQGVQAISRILPLLIFLMIDQDFLHALLVFSMSSMLGYILYFLILRRAVASC